MLCHVTPPHTPFPRMPFAICHPPLCRVHPSRYITPRLSSSDTGDTGVCCAYLVGSADTGGVGQSCYKSRGALNPAGLAHRVITLAFLPCTPLPLRSPNPNGSHPMPHSIDTNGPIPSSDTKSSPPITNTEVSSFKAGSCNYNSI